MKKSLLVVVLAISIVALGWTATSQAAEKIVLCHIDNGSNAYEVIEVGSENSAATHIENHGDFYFIDEETTPCESLNQ